MNRLVDGRYELIEVIGSGGMATVWRAHDAKLQRSVALKRPHPVPVGDPRFDRLSREAKLAASISHPHLVTVHDAGADEDGLYLVMELVEAPSLADVGSGLRRDEIIEVGIQISRALAAIHRAGIVHRDVKPANILMADGGAKLTDFGIATSDQPMAGHQPTTPGLFLATANYAAPEVLAGHAASDKTDIFALGVVLYELLAGRPPFAGVDRSARPRSLDDPVGPILDQCLSPYPTERPDGSLLASSLGSVLSMPGGASAGQAATGLDRTSAPAVDGNGHNATTSVMGPAPGATYSGAVGHHVPSSPPVAGPSAPPTMVAPTTAAPSAYGAGGPPTGPNPTTVGPPNRPPSRSWIGPALAVVLGLGVLFIILSLLNGALRNLDGGSDTAATEDASEPTSTITVPTSSTTVTEPPPSTIDDAETTDPEVDDDDGGSGFGFGGILDSIESVEDLVDGLDQIEDFVDSVEDSANELDERAKAVQEILKKIQQASELAQDAKPEESAKKLEEAAREANEKLDGEARERALKLLDQVAEQLGLTDLDLTEQLGESDDD